MRLVSATVKLPEKADERSIICIGYGKSLNDLEILVEFPVLNDYNETRGERVCTVPFVEMPVIPCDNFLYVSTLTNTGDSTSINVRLIREEY